ncbi:MAG TPA: hypothetical protein VKA73_11775 [Rubrobacter sp.]|nr:hypothetical protein [Rubrobacter sp.]
MRFFSGAGRFAAEPSRDWVAGLLLLGGLFLIVPSLVWTAGPLPLLMGASLATMGAAEFLPAGWPLAVRLTRLIGTVGMILTFLGGLLWFVLSPESFLTA